MVKNSEAPACNQYGTSSHPKALPFIQGSITDGSGSIYILSENNEYMQEKGERVCHFPPSSVDKTAG